MNAILHVVPSAIRSCTFDGTYKDIIGRARLFESSGIDYRQAAVTREDTSEMEQALAEFTPTHVLIEYTYHRHLLNQLRQRLPNAVIAARAHNIEALQHFENHGLFPARGPAWMLYGMMRLSLSDALYRRKANIIYPISEWEGRVYWRWLPGNSAVKWLPYFPPDFTVSRRADSSKQDLIACLPGTTDSPRNRDTVMRFLSFARIAREIAPDYRFLISGNLNEMDIRFPDYVELPGLVHDIADILAEARAVALMSPRGYGFKTTMADALANGCYTLVHPVQFGRTPSVLKEGCIPIETVTHATVAQALERISEPFRHMSSHVYLREMANDILRQDFFG